LLYHVISHLMHSTQASTVSYFTLHLLRVLYLVLPLRGYCYHIIKLHNYSVGRTTSVCVINSG